ncbi:MAG: hypothetical protein JRG73_13675 [Deltaproteobacteria bacterium]|nr:hypothetical protein [Deltaproteobacteria bacterium]
MSRVIRISESIFQRLQKLAIPLEDTPASVIEKLLDFYDSRDKQAGPTQVRDPLLTRPSKQRGITIKVDGQSLTAVSVADLYRQVLRFLADEGYLNKLKVHLPIATSAKRYLVAAEPFHPNGKKFVHPVEYQGFHMEAHKDYRIGIKHLRKMLDLCGLSLSISVMNSSMPHDRNDMA